jgi:hypothetical protein
MSDKKKTKKTGCGKNPNGKKTHNQCFKSGIGVGMRIKNKPTKYTKESLNKMKKGGLEDLGKRVFGLKNMRKTKKADIIKQILQKQKK